MSPEGERGLAAAGRSDSCTGLDILTSYAGTLLMVPLTRYGPVPPLTTTTPVIEMLETVSVDAAI